MEPIETHNTEDNEPVRQCKAHLRNGSGKRCKKPAIKGGSVCASHGGAAPQVKKAAKQRLADLVDPAIACLNRAIKQTGDLSTGVRASQIVLDRTGYHPTQAVIISDPDDVLAKTLGVEKDKLPE